MALKAIELTKEFVYACQVEMESWSQKLFPCFLIGLGVAYGVAYIMQHGSGQQQCPIGPAPGLPPVQRDPTDCESHTPGTNPQWRHLREHSSAKDARGLDDILFWRLGFA